MNTNPSAPSASAPSGPSRTRAIITTIVILAVLFGAGWAYMQVRTNRLERARTESALKLQVLTSRLGAAAIRAEYGDFEGAREIASGVFDGIQNYGIEHGSLPENYARVLETRDEVIAALATRDESVKGRLTELFFRLQLPVDTQLDPARIIPATDSGAGMAPPRRMEPEADTVRTEPIRPAPGVDSIRGGVTG